MQGKEEKRQWPRREVSEPEPGLVHDCLEQGAGKSSRTEFKPCFIGVLNKSQGGMLIESARGFKKGSILFLSVSDRSLGRWLDSRLQVAWTKAAVGRQGYLAGLMSLPAGDRPGKPLLTLTQKQSSMLADVDFLLQTELFENIPQRAVNYLLNCLTLKKMKAGKKLISQGREGDALYIIRQGSCEVKTERNGVSQVVNTIGAGGVVGEMAVLTGEKRSFDVLARTDLVYWELARQQYDAVAGEYHDLRIFLTELLTKRLESSQLAADRTVGKYQIRLKLGQGAWGIVYLGRHEVLNMPVAIKMLKHQMALAEEFRKRFRNEARIIARLKHPNIVDVYDIEERYQTVFIVMELLEGETLEARLLRVRTMPVAPAVNCLVQICNGLAYAHGEGIVHQDIKPANIFLHGEDQVKILDFGLACPMGYEGENLLGTIQYSAPEAINSNQVDARSDIYSLGITAFEMITGKRPYPEEDLSVMVEMRGQREIPDPAGLVADLPEALRRFILKACRRDPGQRYQSIAAALEELMPLYHELVDSKGRPAAARKAFANLNVLYREDQAMTAKKLLDEFSRRASEMGVLVKAVEFKDIF